MPLDKIFTTSGQTKILVGVNGLLVCQCCGEPLEVCEGVTCSSAGFTIEVPSAGTFTAAYVGIVSGGFRDGFYRWRYDNTDSEEDCDAIVFEVYIDPVNCRLYMYVTLQHWIEEFSYFDTGIGDASDGMTFLGAGEEPTVLPVSCSFSDFDTYLFFHSGDVSILDACSIPYSTSGVPGGYAAKVAVKLSH